MKIFSLVLIFFLIIFNAQSFEVGSFFESDIFQKLRPLLIPIILVSFFILRKSDKDKIENTNIDQEIENEMDEQNNLEDNKEYEDEWNYDNHQNQNLTIRIEEKNIDNIESYVVMANGLLNFTNAQIEETKKENEEVKYSCYVFDSTEENIIPLKSTNETFKDDEDLLSQFRNMKVGLNFAYNEWTPMFIFPKSMIEPPYRGNRKLKFIVTASKLNAKFEQGKIIDNHDFYYDLDATFEIEFNQPGYLEAEGFEEEVNDKIVQLGMAVTYSEKEINQLGIDALKSWINKEIVYKDFYSDQSTDKLSKKLKYSFLLKNTFELLKTNKLSMSDLIREINYKTNIPKRYDIMNLLLNIAGADDRLSAAEDKLLNNTARALELNIDKFQQMKTSTIANIETIDENHEGNEETIFNFTADMSNEEKCKKLRHEYTRWNRQTNNSNEKIRNQARKMVELTASLRKKYNC